MARLIWDAVGELSPPYGDSTAKEHADWHIDALSPPYGDSTKSWAIYEEENKFSPPYVDSTEQSSNT